jgi:alkylated DNA repair dioxygenase AlkB
MHEGTPASQQLYVGLQRFRVSTGLDVFYVPDFVAEARTCTQRLHAECAWRPLTIRLFGRHVPVPRMVAWQGEQGVTYGYSGQRHRAQGFSPTVQSLRARVESALQLRFNFVLLNLYRNGNDSMGWHADDERELGQEPVIASLSFGVPRRFCLRRRADRRVRHDLMLGSGSLLVMAGRTQVDWQHSVPRARAVAVPRINLTFRRIVAGTGAAAGDGR